jgi:serine/threonine-protein kinase
VLRFSDFILERLLGSGAMGKVYRARDKRSGNIVAVKSLHKSRQTDARAVGQFLREAQILASLSHPGIVGVRGLGRFPGGGYFLVMDYMDGTDLEARLRSGPLPLHEATAIVTQVASAVAYAHAHGVVHCDLKPANILLDGEGRAVVTDFGFAWLTIKDPRRIVGAIGGTTGYIAPEVLFGRRQPTPASDIYALGVLLWVLVTGIVPMDSADLVGGPSELATIAEIVRRCMATDPRARLSSALELQQRVQVI